MKERAGRTFDTQKGGRKMERVFAVCIPTYTLGKKNWRENSLGFTGASGKVGKFWEILSRVFLLKHSA
jgi:hypothetical protein